MSTDASPSHRAPAGLKAPGRRLWQEIAGGFELDEHELALLREMCRTADVLDTLDEIVRREGAIVAGSHGGQKAHPALVEARQQRIALARLTAVLRLPQGEEDHDVAPGRRTQRRGGARGVYGIRGAVS